MNIQPDDPRWTAYVLGELSESERQEVERELESSEEARELVEDIRMMSVMLKDELVKEAPAALSSAQRHELMLAAAASPEPVSIETRRVPFWRRPKVYAVFAAGAAAAVLLFTVSVPSLLRSRQAMPLDAMIAPSAGAGPAVTTERAAQNQPKPVSEPDPPETSLYAEKELKQSSDKNQVDGALTGVLADSSAAQIPGVRVTVTSPTTEERDAVTDETGRYKLEGLPAGTYTARYELPGFKTLVQSNIVVPPGQSVTVSPKLEVASVSEQVTVSLEEQNKDKKVEQPAAKTGVLSGALGGVLRAQNEPSSQQAAQGQQGQQGQQQNVSGPRQSPMPFGNAARAGISAREASPPVAAAAPPPPPPPPPSPARLDAIDRRFNTEAYSRIEDNPFKSVLDNPLATFSIDVDTASYANMRRFLNQNQLPPKDSVRIEELVNYFNYDYPSPNGSQPIGVYTEVAAAPWQPQHRLVRVGIKAKEIDMNRRPASNLVFLIDAAGSMASPQKLSLVKSALKLLVDQLTENDRVAIVAYAGGTGLVLPPTTGDKKQAIFQTLDRLDAGVLTNGAGGIQLAYETAVANFIRGGVNRVVLCTDGDFNVGITNQGDLTRLIEDKARSGVFLSVLGFGMGNLKDSTMEQLADKGNGNYAYIDSLNEARKVLVEEMGGTLMTVAKDVKIQVDFNPAQVSAYRLIGYENRALRNEDFNDDAKDAGDMGAGHTVTALFEIVPPGAAVALAKVDESKYRQPAPLAATAAADRRNVSSEMLTVRVRYKLPDAADSTRFDVPLVDRKGSFEAASPDYRFAAAVAEFGMILRESPYRAQASLDQVIGIAERSKGLDRNGYREEFIGLARRARSLRDLRQ